LQAGGAIWLTGVFFLESGHDPGSVEVRAAFLVAGLLIAAGIFVSRSWLPARTARLGAICSAVAGLAIGIGFAAGSFMGFLLVYFGVLFALPLGLGLLGVGLWRGGGMPPWAAWIPVLLAAAGAVTYGFHALARQVWDPPDSVMFIIYGVGWMLLGIASLSPFTSIQTQRPSRA